MATISVARPTRLRADPLQVALYGAMAVVMTVALLPFVWAFLTSLKPERQVFAFPPQLFPDPATLYNYGRAIDHGLLLALFNSTVISLMTVGLVLVAGSLAAYALARINFRGSQLVLFLIIVPMMIPGLVNLVPTYIVMAKLGLLDSYQGLILIYWVHSLPLAIWVLQRRLTDVGVNWGEMMASALALNLPVLALFLLLQRRFIAGLTAGALRL